ncbi:MAG: acyl carrier protein phosphodiesterase [Flavobacteriaceae bacterium]|jgi:acyl carrier protein phosphodiesterase|tara:strand:+ start:221 stop:805 length:585 start_codon:yes stop_codon:yes gene_type:complete
MNFLAHVYLSENNLPIPVGNLIADRVKGKGVADFSPMIQKGIFLHRRIDNFTDRHKLFKECVPLLFPTYRHYSRVIVDMYFDHFLAANWTIYHLKTLEYFTTEFYIALQKEAENLPKKIQKFTAAIIRYNWFKHYKTISGLKLMLMQMEQRTQFSSKLSASTPQLKENYTYFHDHFSEFMTEVIEFTKNERTTL